MYSSSVTSNGTPTPHRPLPPFGGIGLGGDSHAIEFDNGFNPNFGDFDQGDAKVLTPETIKKLDAKVEPSGPSHAAVEAAAGSEDPKRADADFSDAQRLNHQQSGGLESYGFVESLRTSATEKRKVLKRLSNSFTSQMKSRCPVDFETTGKFGLPGNLNELLAVVVVVFFVAMTCTAVAAEVSVMVRMLGIYASEIAGPTFWNRVAFAFPAIVCPTMMIKFIQFKVQTTALRWFTAFVLILGATAAVSVFTVYPMGILGNSADA